MEQHSIQDKVKAQVHKQRRQQHLKMHSVRRKYSSAGEKWHIYFMLDEWTGIWLYFGLFMDRKRRQKEEKCAAIILLWAFDSYCRWVGFVKLKIYDIHIKQVTVMFYQAINFICTAEEPICYHFGNQETGPKTCGPICFYQLSFWVLSTHLQGKF